MQGKGNKINKEHLAQWASLALKKALTPSNIRARFKGCDIWPLNFEAMKAKMGPSKAFRDSTCAEFQEDILIQEIWEECLPNVEEGVVHYFVDHESDEDELLPTTAAENSPLEEEEAENSALFSTFLRLPQAPTTRKTIVQPLVDYSQSQILTSSQHVEAMKDIATQKEEVQLQREERARTRELTKHKRAEEKLKEVAAKVDRAATKEAKRKFKDKWTKDAIEDAGEKLHECIRKGGQISDQIPYLGRQPWQCKWNQEVEILKFKAKRRRRESGIPLPFQLPWFHGVQQILLEQGVPQRLLSPQAIPPWIFMQGPPGQTLFQPSQGGMFLNGGLHSNLPSTVNVGCGTGAFSAWGGGTNVTALSGLLQQRTTEGTQFDGQALSGGAAALAQGPCGTVTEEGVSRQQRVGGQRGRRSRGGAGVEARAKQGSRSPCRGRRRPSRPFDASRSPLHTICNTKDCHGQCLELLKPPPCRARTWGTPQRSKDFCDGDVQKRRQP